jgi:dihydroorotate dehydrogenase (NAD+) catalytic subunit
VTKDHGIPIIGQGGVTTADDAIEFLLAGASAIGVGTALFYDPLILPKINQGIVDYLERHRLEHVSQLTGALQLNTQRPAQQCGC